jgi:hypothetical protein
MVMKISTHEVISVIEEAFGDIDIPACISLVDTDGLIIHSIGSTCGDQIFLESLNAHLIMSFELTMEKLLALNEILDSLVVHTGEKVFYIDDIRGREGLFIIVESNPNLMNKVLPFLKNFVQSIEKTLGRQLV